MSLRVDADRGSRSAVVESLEERRMFSAFSVSLGGSDLFGSTVVGGVFVGAGNNFVDLGQPTIGLTSRVVSLPSLSSGLPSQTLALPPQSIGLQGFGSANTATPTVNLRGSFLGTADVAGVGSTRMNLSITRQRAGSVNFTLALRRLGLSVAGRAQVSFLGGRQFTFTLSRASDTVVVAGRLSRAGAITGTITGQVDTRRLDGRFFVQSLKG